MWEYFMFSMNSVMELAAHRDRARSSEMMRRIERMMDVTRKIIFISVHSICVVGIYKNNVCEVY
jgi:ABC-type enterochelin transport system ATPase subunit